MTTIEIKDIKGIEINEADTFNSGFSCGRYTLISDLEDPHFEGFIDFDKLRKEAQKEILEKYIEMCKSGEYDLIGIWNSLEDDLKELSFETNKTNKDNK